MAVKVESLKAFPIFKGMTENQIESAASSIREKRYKAGEEIWKEGEDGKDVLLLLSGEVEITQRLTLFNDDDEAQVADKSLIRLTSEMKPVIGEIALCANTPRSAAVIARTNVIVGLFTADALEAGIQSDPHFGYLLYKNLASIVAQRLITANQNVIKLTTAFSLAVRRGI